MVALETGIFVGRQENITGPETKTDVETYALIFDKKGAIFLSGDKTTGFNTIHGFIDPGESTGDWLVNNFIKLGLSEKDLKGFDVFPGVRQFDFEERKIEVVGILSSPEVGQKLVDIQDVPAGFIEIDLLVNWDYEFLTPDGLGRILDYLACKGVIHTPEIFLPEA